MRKAAPRGGEAAFPVSGPIPRGIGEGSQFWVLR